MKRIAKIQWEKRNGSPCMWVADLPGCNGDQPDSLHPKSDWGYSPHKHYALPLTPEQQEQLTADRLHCGQLPPVFFDAE